MPSSAGRSRPVAGVHRRAVRRTFGVGANLGYRGFYHRNFGPYAYHRFHPVARAAVAGAAWDGGWGWGGGWGGWGWNRPLYSSAAIGWGGGWGGWGFNRPLYASAALGMGGTALGMGGYGFGLGAAFCYPTFDYSTGWNQFCPGTGFAFGNRPAQ